MIADRSDCKVSGRYENSRLSVNLYLFALALASLFAQERHLPPRVRFIESSGGPNESGNHLRAGANEMAIAAEKKNVIITTCRKY